jgi:D-beta-D-heptose 7-phosphate kinase/D-beta-D-heptose 1-phosphate adenosyltransferase
MTGRDHELSSSIEAWSGVRILCAGDVMLDRFVYGNAARISPEAPIPVLLIDHEETMLGGAGNVVRNLAALGARASFVTAAGDDAEGAAVESLLGRLPGCSATVVRDPMRRTSVKTRYLAHSQQLLRVDAEHTMPVCEEIMGRLLTAFEAALASTDLVVLSDYAKGVLSGTHASRFIAACRAAGKPVFVDPKGADFGRYRGATLIKPNLRELAETTRMSVEDDAAAEAASRSLIAETGIEAVLVTRGPAGAMLVRRGMPAATFRSLAREVYDVSGAGDTVAATLAVGAAAGLDLADAVRIACVAAGIVVGKIGTATVTSDELVRQMEWARHGAAEIRVYSEADALQRVLIWRRAGLRIEFVSGGWSPLRAADVAELREAREKCDRLVVGVTSGSAHGMIVAALASVDLAVCLDGDPVGFRQRAGLS